MSLSSEIIISNQNHPGDSVDTTHTGSKFKGDGYYGVEATGSHIKNFTGNYVWVRAIISNWTDGNVASILLNH